MYELFEFFFKYIFYIYYYYLKKFQQTRGHGPLIDLLIIITFFTIKGGKMFVEVFLLFLYEFIISYDTFFFLRKSYDTLFRVIDSLYIFKVKLAFSRTFSCVVVRDDRLVLSKRLL